MAGPSVTCCSIFFLSPQTQQFTKIASGRSVIAVRELHLAAVVTNGRRPLERVSKVVCDGVEVDGFSSEVAVAVTDR